MTEAITTEELGQCSYRGGSPRGHGKTRRLEQGPSAWNTFWQIQQGCAPDHMQVGSRFE